MAYEAGFIGQQNMMRHIIEINTTDKKISSSHHQPTMFPAAIVDMISMGSSHPTLDT